MYIHYVYTRLKNNMFGEDPFDRIAREFFGANRDLGGQGNGFIENEEEERNIDFVQTENYVYVVFELPGYKEGDVEVSVNGSDLRVLARGKATESHDDYIARKLQDGVSITKLLPKFVVSKGYKTSFRNGVLEICFKKK